MPKIQSDHFRTNTPGTLTLWDLIDPEATAQAAIELYGSSAATGCSSLRTDGAFRRPHKRLPLLVHGFF
ncbi:hypothetical protein [Mesorhizobium sp. M0488]|uniref:hypothetical protein n=1 Tax=unclassified Mesorhizobium TaxID=325217 RepID=UPI00333985E6